MTDTFILSTDNFKVFNHYSEIPLVDPITVNSLDDYTKFKKAFRDLSTNLFSKTLLYKNTRFTDACILNGTFYPLGCGRVNHAYPLVDYNNLPSLVPLTISIGDDVYKHRTVKKVQLDTFLTTLELSLPDDTPIRIYTRDSIDV